MTLRYAVGIRIGNRADQMTVEAEDALIAALKVKAAHPEAAITYVRKRNARGDRRHPHSSQIDENPAGQAAGDAARSRSSVLRALLFTSRRRARLDEYPAAGRETLGGRGGGRPSSPGSAIQDCEVPIGRYDLGHSRPGKDAAAPHQDVRRRPGAGTPSWRRSQPYGHCRRSERAA